MKDLYHLNSKAYKEGYDILRLLPQTNQEKIPIDIWQFIEEKMDLHYQGTFENAEKNNLEKDTNLLLAILYKAYLATEEEKTIIQAKETAVRKRKEAEAYQRYNPNDVFKNTKQNL